MNSSVTFKILTDISQMTGLKPGSHPRVARIASPGKRFLARPDLIRAEGLLTQSAMPPGAGDGTGSTTRIAVSDASCQARLSEAGGNARPGPSFHDQVGERV